MLPRFSPNYDLTEISLALKPAGKQAVASLEQAFAERTGHKAAIAFRYGRSGLYYLLKALGAQGKKVLMPSYTCVVVAYAVVESGNIPVFVDNAPGEFQPDPQTYLKWLDDETVMVIPTHLFGLAQETETLCHTIKARYPQIFILQDCAHGYFCKDSQGRPVAAFGDGCLFGLNISKLVNSVHGGMLTLQDEALAKKIRQFREPLRANIMTAIRARLYCLSATFAFTPQLYSLVHTLLTQSSLLDSEAQYYDPQRIFLPADYQDYMQNFEAEIGCCSLHKYETRVARRRTVAHYYTERLQGLLPRLVIPRYHQGHSWSHYPVLLPAECRDSVKYEIEQLLCVELGSILDYSVADLPAFENRGHTSCPNAVETCRRILNLPLTFQEGLLPVNNWQAVAEAVCTILINRVAG